MRPASSRRNGGQQRAHTPDLEAHGLRDHRAADLWRMPLAETGDLVRMMCEGIRRDATATRKHDRANVGAGPPYDLHIVVLLRPPETDHVLYHRT
jgi:hypothetical protein